MSLDIELYIDVDTGGTEKERVVLFDKNITHNLGKMADKAGLYYPLWRPEEIDAYLASDIIEKVLVGYEKLKGNPEYYKKFDAPNGWGIYEHFLPFVEEYLKALVAHPKAMIYVSR